MPDDIMLEILKDIQRQLRALPRMEAELATLVRSHSVLQQDVRMLRAALNDFARTNVTAGEIEALHFDVNRLQADVLEHATRLHVLEHEPST